MSFWEGIILAIVQGLTEFLPVSSSGHLVIVQSLLSGFEQPGVLFDVMLHFGTLTAVLFFLRKEVIAIVKAFIPGKSDKKTQNSAERKIAYAVLIATVVTGSIGIAFEKQVHALFHSLHTVPFMLVITGILLFISDRIKSGERGDQEVTFLDGFLLGLVQGISLIPGISRSGSTIAAGIFRGLKGETAARFSFLISIPAILGAMILEMRYAMLVPAKIMLIYFISMIIAGITGFMTLKMLLYVISKRRLSLFAYYCWALALVTFSMAVIL
ncbi:MAG: undecaprenyl-diphosphate phosphatase [Syntrophales bacterium]|nr:undecaprenyl-diphosphate phosphatase [Syntrophales bacterium]MDY0043424.1 undecaprenyl-diphosphate phosphatase [Syntrophales bacterium]